MKPAAMSSAKILVTCVLRVLLPACLAVGSVATPIAEAQNAAESPAFRRAAALGTGVNIPHWFWIGADDSERYVTTYFTKRDADQLVALGIRHVRVPVLPQYLWDADKDTLRADRVLLFKNAITMITGAGLMAIVDPHYSAEVTPWLREGEPTGRAEELEKFWSALGAALKDTDPERVILEILNEPHDLAKDAGGNTRWPQIQRGIAGAVRAVAPAHTMIATGDDWGGLPGLLKLEPLADSNVIYSFHFYEPMTFTHQGADWGAPNWKYLRDVPFPADAASIAAAKARTPDDAARGELGYYLDQNWSADRIKKEIAAAAEWSRKHAVPVYCGEFGVYRRYAGDAARARWLSSVTDALEDNKIPRAMWDYQGGFALMNLSGPERRTRSADVLAAHALRLSLPAPARAEGQAVALLPPPPGAAVLFDGRSTEQWLAMNGGACPWRLVRSTGNGPGELVIAPGTGSIVSKPVFGDAQIHIEFRIDPAADARAGQDLGNSGVYVQSRYEVQVLESYTGTTYPEGQCGAIYGQYVPRVNASLAPGEWQSFDIYFRGARYGAGGERSERAVMTVFHNGVLIHNQVPLAGPTGGSAAPEDATPRGIMLQDHGHPVRYRNIWVLALE